MTKAKQRMTHFSCQERESKTETCNNNKQQNKGKSSTCCVKTKGGVTTPECWSKMGVLTSMIEFGVSGAIRTVVGISGC